MPKIITSTKYAICRLDPETNQPAYWLKHIETFHNLELSATLIATQAKTWKTQAGAQKFLDTHARHLSNYTVAEIPK